MFFFVRLCISRLPRGHIRRRLVDTVPCLPASSMSWKRATGTPLAIQGCAVRGMRGLSLWETSRAAPSPVEREDRRARKQQWRNNLHRQATWNKASTGILLAPTNPFTVPQPFLYLPRRRTSRAVNPLTVLGEPSSYMWSHPQTGQDGLSAFPGLCTQPF